MFARDHPPPSPSTLLEFSLTVVAAWRSNVASFVAKPGQGCHHL